MPATYPRNHTRASSLGKPAGIGNVPTRTTETVGQNNHYGRPTKPKSQGRIATEAEAMLRLGASRSLRRRRGQPRRASRAAEKPLPEAKPLP